MKNRDMPAKPIFNNEGSTYDGYGSNNGLTKLEYAAIQIMSGMQAHHDVEAFPSRQDACRAAVKIANALFDELEKQ